jgi:hypothetical protein
MNTTSTRVQVARSFLAALFLTLGTATFLAAAPAQSADPCRCTYDQGALQQPNPIPSNCHLIGTVVTVLTWVPGTAENGQCTLPGCVERNCTGQGSLTVIADSLCPLVFYKDAQPVSRAPGLLTVYINDNIECGDFVDYSILVGGTTIVSLTNICWPCGSGH